MSRRVSLPRADDIFRATAVPDAESPTSEPGTRTADDPAEDENGSSGSENGRAPSGRVRHDEKMTVYVTADELLDLEHARLMLRRNQGLAVDRGRLVREAIAIALADIELNGDDSLIVQRLTQA